MTLDLSELDNRLFEGFADTSRRRYVYVCNMKTNISRWSKNAIEEFDLPGEYMQDAGTIWADFVHPEDREQYEKEIDAIFTGEKIHFDLDYRARNREDEYVLCTGRGHVVRGEGEAADLFVGSIENHGIMDKVDAITSLYNIYEFWNIMRSLKESEQKITVLLIGLNNFSEINDMYGYDFGNKVLRKFANIVTAELKERGIAFRMDGVQFACCLKDFKHEEVQELYKMLKYEARHNIYVDGMRVAVSLSGGAVVYDKSYDVQALLTSVRYAYIQSKHRNHGELKFFDYSFLQDNKKNLEFMNVIRKSIINKFEGFFLCYQPIVDASSEELIGAEALLRWRKDEFGEVPPGMFIPWLENDPSFWDLGRWILWQAMSEAKPILEKYPDFILNINVAYPQLSHSRFCEVVQEVLIDTGFPAKNLCLELTERCRQLDREFLQIVTECLREMGIRIAIDDFGTGFSSLELLGDLHVDTLKIDRGFIRDIQTNLTHQAIVRAVTECAQDLSVHVCMEGLEDREMIDFVKQYGVYSYQGYYFAKPMPMEQFIGKYSIGD